MKKILKIFLLVACVFATINTFDVKAASGGYARLTGNTTVEVGNTVTITATIGGNNMYFALGNVSSNNPSVLSGGGQITNRDANGFSSHSQSFTFTANTVGTATITLTVDNENTIDLDGTSYGIEGASITINVVPKSTSGSGSSGNSGGGSNSGSSSSGSGSSTTTPVTDNRSSNNNLSSLSISEGELSPAFSSDVTEYSVELASSVTSITVNASASDAKASVSGTGEISLNAGDNRIEITVTAENGNPKLYVINAYVDEAPLVFVSYGDNELGVVRNLNGVTLEGFEETSVQIDGNEVKAWHSPTRNITVVYLEKDDEKNFYIYDETEGITSVYKQVAILGNTLGIVDVPEDLQERAGMTYQEITIDDVTLMGWVYEDKAFSNYSLIYAMNDMGEYQYYQYESSQNTLQLYSGAAAVTQEDYENLVNHSESMQLYFYIALGGCVVLLAVSVYGFVCASRYKKRLISKGNELNDIIKAD